MSDEPTWNLSDEESTQNRETLDATIASLYVAFRHRKLSPGGPDVCTGCCMPLDAKQRVATTPKQAICFEDLREFQSAAKGGGAGQDMAYLLPRTMESVAAGREQGAGLFSLFSNYFPPVWPTLRPGEKEAVRNFYTALTRWRLGLREDVDCEFGIAEIIEMCGSGGNGGTSDFRPARHSV